MTNENAAGDKIVVRLNKAKKKYAKGVDFYAARVYSVGCRREAPPQSNVYTPRKRYRTIRTRKEE